MRFILLVRLITLVLAVLYSLHQIDYDAIAMRLDRSLAITAETGHSWIITAGTIGVYVTSLLVVLLALFAVPRWHFGIQALSWCFFLMSVSLLTRLLQCWWLRYLVWSTQVPCYIHEICFALPALIMFAFLQHRTTQTELQRAV